MKTRRNKLSSWIAISSLGITPLLVPATAFAATNRLEEVVVEAQKKVETVTETPIAIQAITGDQFQKYAGFDLQDIARTTPGLSFDTGPTTDIHMRGVSTVTLAGVSLRTNIYQDGVLMEQPRVVFDSQYDIERFEVLKGSQGTLYGKSSPTGTINVRTKNPNLSAVEGYVSGSIGERNLHNTQFGISLPIIENELAIRLAAVYDENQTSGSKNVTTGHVSQSRASGARATVLWEPNDQLTARLSFQYREKKDNSSHTVDGDGLRAADNKFHSNVEDYNQYRDQLAILEVNYALDDHLTLTSVTGYEDQDYNNLQDSDAVGSVPLPSGAPNGAVQFSHIPIRPQVQEDLRLASEDNAFWDWQVGFFYQRSTSNVVVTPVVYNATARNYTYINTAFVSNLENYALYTHNTFKITDDFNIIAGLRYQVARYQSSEPTTISLPAFNYTASVDGIPLDQQRKTYYPITGTLKAQYFFNPDLMSYVTLDRAFRSGGANLNIGGNLPNDFAGIDAETANSIEAGLKGNFGDQRGRFALAAFDQIYQHFQQDVENVSVVDPSNPNIGSMVQVAKQAETRGVEFSVDWLLQDNWTTSLNLAFTDSKFKDFKNAIAPLDATSGSSPCGTTPAAGKTYATCDFSGQRLPLSSRWSGNMASNYSLPAFAGSDWYLNALVNFQSNQIDKVTRNTLGGYSTVDFFTGLRSSKSNTWDVSLWLKNAFDRRAILRIYREGLPATFNPDGSPAAGGPTFNLVTTNTPRQAGVTGTYRF